MESVALPDRAEIVSLAEAHLSQAKALQVIDQGTYINASAVLKNIKTTATAIAEKFADPKSKAAAAHKAIVAMEKEHLVPLGQAEQIIKGKMITWSEEQERIRRIEEARLREEARKREEERMLAEATAAEADGDKAEADRLLAAPVEAPAINLPSATPAVQGVSYAEVWRCEVVDPAAVPRQFLIVDEKSLNALARAQKGAFRVAGCKAVCEKQARVR